MRHESHHQGCRPEAHVHLRASRATLTERVHARSIYSDAQKAMLDRAETRSSNDRCLKKRAACSTDAQLRATATPAQAHAGLFDQRENSMGFHAPAECLRILGESIDYARQGTTEVARLGLRAGTSR